MRPTNQGGQANALRLDSLMTATPAPQETARVQQRLHIPSLDGLRAVAFLLVFFGHASVGPGFGRFGVTVFFFLSGYLITTLLRLEQEQAGAISLRHFYLRRALRILPPLYLTLAAAVLAGLAGLLGPSPFTWAGVAAVGAHLANYWMVLHGDAGLPPGLGVYWSLAVEEHFYLLYPLLFLAVTRWSTRPSVRASLLALLCLAVLLWRAWLSIFCHAGLMRTFVATDTRFDSLLWGCVLAVWRNPALDRDPLPEWTWKWVLLPGALLVLAATHAMPDPYREAFRYTLQGVALIPVFHVLIRFPRWGPGPLLNHPLAAKVGALSYSLYLFHDVALVLAVRHGGLATAGVLLAAALTLIYAEAMYRWVERPCARLRRSLGGA
jgi:peptidoglycan/LPS O-acetylase OafA/YrhL